MTSYLVIFRAFFILFFCPPTHFQSFFISFFVPPTQNLKKNPVNQLKKKIHA